MTRQRWTRWAAIPLAMMFLLAACSGDSDDAGTEEFQVESLNLAAEGDPTDTTAASAELAVEPAAGDEVTRAAQEPTAPNGALTATGITGEQGQELVIRDAFIEVRVTEFDRSWDELRRLAGAVGGFVADASTSTEDVDGETYSVGSVTLRIPATSFDAVMDDVGALGERLSQSVNGTDVSEEYVDLEARLRHWRSVETFTLGLMDDATTIKDSITVQDRLSEIQLTIEQIEGRLRFLDDRTAFSTVTVAVTEAPVTAPPVDPVDPNPITEAFGEAVEVIMAVLGFMIVATAFVLPFSVIALMAYGAYRLIRRLRPPAPQT